MIAERHHEISVGHAVVGSKKCHRVHGHNLRIFFFCTAPQLDTIGMVIDFGEIKERLCSWLDDNFDHRTLLWEQDPRLPAFQTMDNSVVALPFNPTCENLCEYLVKKIGPQQLAGTGITLSRCRIEETTKCAASYPA